MCKSSATHRALIKCNMSCATWHEGIAHASIKFNRVQIGYIFALFHWMKRLTDEGGEETGVSGENPWRRASPLGSAN